MVDFIALVPRREQAGPTVDRAGRGVMLDRSGFAGQSRRGDDVDAGHAEQQDIGCFHEKTSHFPLRLGNLLIEQPSHFVELLPLPRVHRREFRRLGRRGSPGDDAFERTALKADFRLVQIAREASYSGTLNRFGRRELQSDRQGDGLVEQLVILEQIGEARHCLMQQPPHLDHQSRTLLDQVVPMARDGLQRLIDLSHRQRGQAVTLDRRVEDRFQIMVVGLGIRMQRPTVMVRREGMDNARVESRLAERSLDRLVIDAGHLDGHDRIGQAFRPASLRDKLRQHSQSARGMLDRCRFDQHLAIKIAQHPLGAAFRAVHRDDAEVFRPDGLHPLLDLPRRLPNEPLLRAR